MFWTKKSMKSEEYEELIKKNSSINGTLNLLEQKVAKLETDFRSLRGKMNSMLSEEEEEQPKIPKSFNSLNPFAPM